jgi:nucleotide-binding universal stress UspA family protein
VRTHRSERIAVGIDGSLESHAAARWALAHARSGDTVVLLHAWRPSPAAIDTGLAGDDGGAHALVRHELARLAALPRDEGVELVGEVLHGDARSALCEIDADLLVVGGGTRRRVLGLLLGSVSGHLAHHVGVPMVMVPNPVTGRPSR